MLKENEAHNKVYNPQYTRQTEPAAAPTEPTSPVVEDDEDEDEE
jgi:hypothetical protein